MRFVKYYAGNVAAVGLRGAASDLTWRFGPVSRLRFHRPFAFYLIGNVGATAATSLPRFACQTTIAAQSVRPKPCGQHNS